MKEKLTLQQKLSKRKYKKPSPFINLIYYLLVKLVLMKSYHRKLTLVKKDDINDCKGPCFLIWNHLSRLDHCYATMCAYPKRYSMLAGYNEFFRSKFKFVFKLQRILPKKNYSRKDIGGVKAMTRIIKKGGCVCFSPEGMSSIYGTNQPICPGTGHLFKHFGIPVYFMKLEGQYLTSTKHCLDVRKGEVTATTSLLFTPDQLKEMTDTEIEDAINLAFKHDDFEWNKEKRIKYDNKGNLAQGFSTICYKCPKCGSEFEMEEDHNILKCKKCGNGTKINDYYDLEPLNKNDVLPYTPSKWVENERIDIIKEIRKDPNYSFTEHVKIGYLPPYEYVKDNKTSVICGEGDMTIDHKGIHYVGTKLGKPFNFDLTYKDVFSLIIVTDTYAFALYPNEEFIEIFPDRNVVGKMLLITEEMHRLHVNTWKNFPWNDFMYQNLD